MSHCVFEYGKTVGYNFKLLDIGGGFPGHREGDKLFEDMSCAINSSLQKYFNDDRITVIAEPGTYIAMSPSTLAVDVIGKRLVKQEDFSEVRFEVLFIFIIISDSVRICLMLQYMFIIAMHCTFAIDLDVLH